MRYTKLVGWPLASSVAVDVGHGAGTIDVVANVLGARPDRLDRRSPEFLRDLDRLDDIAEIGPPPEAAAEIWREHFDRVAGQAGRAGGEQLDQRSRLMAGPDLGARFGHERRCVCRLHRRMGEEGRIISRLDRLARGLADVARRVDYPSRFVVGALVERGAVGGEHVLGREFQAFRIVPDDVYLLERRRCERIGIGDDSQVVRAFDQAVYAGDIRGQTCPGEGAPNARRMTNRRVELSLLTGIDAEAGETMNLRRDVEAGGALADIFASRQRRNGDVARREFGRFSGEFAIGCALAVGSDDSAPDDLQFVRWSVEPVGRRARQQIESRSGGSADRPGDVARGGRTARALKPERAQYLVESPKRHPLQLTDVGAIDRQTVEQHDRIGVSRMDRRRLGADRFRRQSQTLGRKQDGQRINALSHLLMRDDDFDHAVLGELEPRAETGFALASRQLVAVDAPEAHGNRPRADEKSAADDAGRYEKRAAGDLSRARRFSVRHHRALPSL